MSYNGAVTFGIGNFMIDETLRGRAYNSIQAKLLDGELRAGDVISESVLAEDIGISRTPVREAIGQLQIEGLLGKMPRVGTVVRLPDRGELQEIYDVREALESHAAAHAQLGESDFAAMDDFLAEMLSVADDMHARKLEFLDEALLHRFFDSDLGFHLTIVRAYGNQRALRVVSESRVAQRIFEYDRVAHGARLVEAAIAAHSAILAALRAGDGEAARIAMGEHIRSSSRLAGQGYERQSVPLIMSARPALSPNLTRRLQLKSVD